MDNDKKLFEGLLKADGINPGRAEESERAIFAKMLDQQPKPKHTKPTIARLDIWRIIMKTRITKLATAAVIIIAAIIGINHFGGSIDGSSVAWAKVLETTQQIPTAIYRIRSEEADIIEGEVSAYRLLAEGIVYFSSDIGYCVDNKHYENTGLKYESKMYYTWAENVQTSLVLSSEASLNKRCLKLKVPKNSREEFRTGWDPRFKVEQIIKFGASTRQLGRKVIDGIEAVGIEVQGYRLEAFEDANAQLWVEAESSLPVKIIIEGKLITFPAKEGQSPEYIMSKAVYDEFEWGVLLKPADFEPVIPPDYIVVEREYTDYPKPTEKALIE